MNNIENPIVQVHDGLLKIRKVKSNFNNDLSTIDGAISDIYHDLEREETIDLYKGYRYAIRLRDLYRARRNLKEQNEQIKSFERFFNIKNSLDNMDRAIMKTDREMPKKRLTRQNDILEKGTIKLKNGWEI